MLQPRARPGGDLHLVKRILGEIGLPIFVQALGRRRASLSSQAPPGCTLALLEACCMLHSVLTNCALQACSLRTSCPEHPDCACWDIIAGFCSLSSQDDLCKI